MYYPSLAEVKSLVAGYNLVPVYREIAADLETPISIYLKINRGANSFLLESVEGGQRLARYSFIGTAPRRLFSQNGAANQNCLEQVESALRACKVAPVDGLPAFCGGAVGYLGYETVTHFETLPTPSKDPLGLPESIFMLTDSLIIFDHVSRSIKAVSYVDTSNPEESYLQATGKINALVNSLRRPLQAGKGHRRESAQKLPEQSNMSREDFEKSVAQIKEYIAAGEAIQVVLSRRLSQPTSAHPFEIYRALRAINPSPYMYYLDFGDFQVIGASPEILVRVENGTVTTRPLAGTRPRGKTPAEDTRLEAELRGDEKERAEHIMLVDLGRNDIGRVSAPGTVEVTELMDVERYSHVMHLVTNVRGELKAGLSAFDALRACFPAGTVSGAPKIRAMQIIAEMEPEKRGVYAGAVGYFSFNGNMDMAIAIRTIVFKDGVAYVQSGGGIVYDSVPPREYEETQNKARALLKAIERAEESEEEATDAIAHR
jgi:anthranilate synthase component I